MRAIAHTNGSFDFKKKEKEKQRLACSIARQSYVQADRRCRKNYTSRRTLNNQVTMVKVWYEPPPGGPRTHLNRGGYYVESARTPAFITRMSKARPITVIIPAIAAISAFCYLPLSK